MAETEAIEDTAVTGFRLRWESDELVLEQRNEVGDFEEKTRLGIGVTPTPLAPVHPEMDALLSSSIGKLREEYIGDEHSLKLVLQPPWGLAWLLEIGDLGEDNVEDQVVWELEQRIGKPIDEFIFAWHPLEGQVYAIVIRPEMIAYWVEMCEESGIQLGSIVLEAGIVDPEIEQSADLLPLFHMWAKRQGLDSGANGGVKSTFVKLQDIAFSGDEEPTAEEVVEIEPGTGPEVEDSFVDEDLGEDHGEDLDEEVSGFDPSEQVYEDDVDIDEFLKKEGKAFKGKRVAAWVWLLPLLILLGAGGWYGNKNKEYLLPRAKRIARLGKSSFIRLKGQFLQKGDATKQTLEDETEGADVGVERSSRQLAARESGSVPSRDGTPEGFLRPGAVPSASGFLLRAFELADSSRIRLSGAVLIGDQLRLQAEGGEDRINGWSDRVALEPGGESISVGSPVRQTSGRVITVKLSPAADEAMTGDQYEDLLLNLDLKPVEAGVIQTDWDGLKRLLATMESSRRRPFRISVQTRGADRYDVVALP